MKVNPSSTQTGSSSTKLEHAWMLSWKANASLDHILLKWKFNSFAIDKSSETKLPGFKSDSKFFGYVVCDTPFLKTLLFKCFQTAGFEQLLNEFLK